MSALMELYMYLPAHLKSACIYRATLHWYDPPNEDGTTNQALLQNLDLKIVSPTNQV